MLEKVTPHCIIGMEGGMVMKNKGNEIAKIIAEDCGDITASYLELGIDAFLDDGILKTIPIVKTIYALIKLPISFYNASSMRKLIFFCYYMKNIPSMERAQYVNKAINEDKHFGEKLLLTVEKIDDLDKMEMLKKIFQAYGNRDGIDYHTFRRLCLALEKTYIEDLNYLKQCIESKKEYFSGEQMINLSNSGLAAMTVVGGDLLNDEIFQVLPLGKMFYECVFTEKYSFIV